ncbi:DJ-1/PfpI family protein [Fulvivirgaceae bacterium BMA12]|uniref:DJ-1/PfpI family protein n=1 Tax=Agaribacillus aureus TaxID=3051825 RepID=A0ABT8L9W5_9BACT|nr:DJ-1/PfpI family protein [Fulvivirgaceae bacterium BMA12]
MKTLLGRTYILLVLILLGSCQIETKTDEPNPHKNTVAVPDYPSPTTTLNIGFLIIDGVYNSELMAPFDIFHHSVFHHEFGMKVFTVAPKMDVVTTFEGIRILPDFSFDSPALPDIDVLVVASAEHNVDKDLENEALISFVKIQGSRAKFVMSLCDGAFVLARSGLVVGKASTTFPGDIDAYRKMFPELTVHEGYSFVHHDNLITSAGGAKSYDAALYLCELLYGKKVARGIAAGLVIDWDLSLVDHLIVQ